VDNFVDNLLKPVDNLLKPVDNFYTCG